MSELKPKKLPPTPNEDDVLRRMLNTRPTPHVPPKAKAKAQKRRKVAK
jgi:hypothetical protein